MRNRLQFALGLAIIGASAACSAGGSQVVTAQGAPPAAEVHTATTGPAEPSTTTTEPPPSTTAPPTTTVAAPPTTVAAPPTTTTTRVVAKPTTTTTFPASAVRLTLKNEFPHPVDLTVNGVAYHLRVGEVRGPVPVQPQADLNDTYSVVVTGTNCGVGDAGPHFQGGPGSAVTLHVIVIPGTACDVAAAIPNMGVSWEGATGGR